MGEVYVGRGLAPGCTIAVMVWRRSSVAITTSSAASARGEGEPAAPAPARLHHP